ncbi:hypothetical protein [Micromonospora endophytica]|uniref:hypothetical protein n=1 Tax=Micromonospora endophytica TaxID=515350 RepID=UPI0011B39E67|nr:hypothetical protein [Micromonospora endophytica]
MSRLWAKFSNCYLARTPREDPSLLVDGRRDQHEHSAGRRAVPVAARQHRPDAPPRAAGVRTVAVGTTRARGPGTARLAARDLPEVTDPTPSTPA